MTMQKRDKEITRKSFLKGVGASVAGIAMAGTMGSLLTACTDGETAQASAETPEWPFEYVELDPDKVRERAFNAYHEQGG